MDSAGLGKDPLATSCEHGNEPMNSEKEGAFLDEVSDCRLVNMDYAPMELVFLIISFIFVLNLHKFYPIH